MAESIYVVVEQETGRWMTLPTEDWNRAVGDSAMLSQSSQKYTYRVEDIASAPSPKGREEREESSSADRYLLHAEWVAKTMLRHYPSAEDGREDTLERESAHVIRRLLARLRTHSPEAVEKDDEGRPYPCGAFVAGDSRWLCRLESDHEGGHEWVQRHSPEEPVGPWPQAVADFLAWAEETFPEATPASCVAHLRSEVEELTDTPDDPEELADAAMLIFHAAYRADVDLHAALRAKLEKNRAREWGPKNEEGFREHVKDPIGQPLDGEGES